MGKENSFYFLYFGVLHHEEVKWKFELDFQLKNQPTKKPRAATMCIFTSKYNNPAWRNLRYNANQRNRSI